MRPIVPHWTMKYSSNKGNDRIPCLVYTRITIETDGCIFFKKSSRNNISNFWVIDNSRLFSFSINWSVKKKKNSPAPTKGKCSGWHSFKWRQDLVSRKYEYFKKLKCLIRTWSRRFNFLRWRCTKVGLKSKKFFSATWPVSSICQYDFYIF